MHICLPSRKGHTRLLYRMSLDFMNWTRFVPGIQIFWQNIANQVCGRPQPRRFLLLLLLLLGTFELVLKTVTRWAVCF